MQYVYSAKSMQGEKSGGVLDADSLAIARQQLRERGLFPLTLSPQSHATGMRTVKRQGLFKKRVQKAELMLLTKQLVIMSRAGVDLAEVLQNVAGNCRNLTLKLALNEIYQDVTEGKSFSVAIKRQVHIFGEAYVASIAAGEASGKVPDVLARLSDVLQNEIKLQSTLKGAVSYPIVLMAVCLFVIGALLLFVLPNFERVFNDMGITPPASTQFLLYCSGELRRRFWLWGGLAILATYGSCKLIWTPSVRRATSNAALRLILVGDVLQSLVAGRLFVMLGTMLQSGVPLIQSLQLCRSAMHNICFQELLDDMQTEVLNGRSIGRVLNSATFVPAGIAQMVGTAEQSGRLGSVMQLVGEYYEAEGQRKMQELAKLLEPLIVIVMGMVVAFVVASIMLPILDLSSTAGR
ncbi:MAG: gspF [Planctomycetaceae bacterium]|nr:gspF [Planctomycetaceae bacterium]